jgi:hypothetical protein
MYQIKKDDQLMINPYAPAFNVATGGSRIIRGPINAAGRVVENSGRSPTEKMRVNPGNSDPEMR